MAKKLKRDAVIDGRSAQRYAKFTKADMVGYRHLARKVSEHVKDGDSVLEVAPGPGYASIELARLGNCSITGMDLSFAFTKIGEENAREAGVDVRFRQGSVDHMPFDDAVFDFIVSRAAYKNFLHPVGALNEMYRVLKKDGKVLIEDLNPNASYKTIKEYANNLQTNWFNKLLNRFIFYFGLRRTAHSKEELEGFIAQSKFEKHEITERPLDYEIWLYK